MPRTTLDIDATVLRQLKQRRRDTGQSLGQIASELLAAALATDSSEPRPLSWKTAAMGARVNLDDKDELYDVLDRQ
jgi:hypothetical protein